MNARPSNILFISPSFFGYESDITQALENTGAHVMFFDERPSNSSLVKAALRIGGRLGSQIVAPYYKRILGAVTGIRLDTFILVKGESIPRSFIQKLRELNPSARFVYYAYDAIPTDSNATRFFDLFDSLYSFDPQDVERYPALKYKPLFYSHEYRPSSDSERHFDVAFVGTLHSDRYRFVTTLFKPFTNSYRFFYVPAKWFFFVSRNITREFAGVAWGDVSFDKLSREEVARVFRESRAVLDLQRTGQSGLTMRTFEVLASGAILVTGNVEIQNADFYDPTRIIVVTDRDGGDSGPNLAEVISSASFPLTPLVGFEKYSIDSWVEQLI